MVPIEARVIHFKMMKVISKATYILLLNYFTDYLDKKDKNVQEITKLGIDGPKNGKKLKNCPSKLLSWDLKIKPPIVLPTSPNISSILNEINKCQPNYVHEALNTRPFFNKQNFQKGNLTNG